MAVPGADDDRRGGLPRRGLHSGEPYSTTDWGIDVDTANGRITWSTSTFGVDPNANALRWGTMYNFWFDADAAPANAVHAVDLFNPVPPAVADAGAGATICAGDTVQIGTPAIPGQTYLWSPGGATTAQIDVSPLVTTVYTVTATNNCATADDTVTVTVEDAPAAPGARPSRRRRDWPPADRRALLVNASAGAADYTVELATNAAFTQNLQSQTVATTQATFSGLGPVQHFWRVTANGTCTGSPSVVFDFTVTNELFIDGFESEDTSAWSLTIP